MLAWFNQSIASVSEVLAPRKGLPRSYDSLPFDDYDRLERGGGGGPPQISMAQMPPLDPIDEEERALAQFSQSLPSEERMRLIYTDIKKTSPQVRLSNLYVYDMISTIETIRGAGPNHQDEYRDVMWMTATHLYMDIILHNRRAGGAFPGCKVHVSNLASMAMRGVYKTHVNACAELVWRTLYAQGYELYSEEGQLLKEAPPDPCHQKEKDKKEEEEEGEREPDSSSSPSSKRNGGKIPFELLHDPGRRISPPTRVYVDDLSPPDVDVRDLEGRVRHNGKNQRVAESSKDK